MVARAVLLVVHVLAEGASKGRGMRARKHGERGEALGMMEGGDPRDLPAPVVPHEMEWSRAVAARRGEIQHVGHQPVDAVGSEARRIRADAGRVAALVGSDRAIARGAEGGDLLAPRVAGLRIPVEEEHERSVGGACALRGEEALGSADGLRHPQSRAMTESAKSSITRYCRLSGGESKICFCPPRRSARPRAPAPPGGPARHTGPPRAGG